MRIFFLSFILIFGSLSLPAQSVWIVDSIKIDNIEVNKDVLTDFPDKYIVEKFDTILYDSIASTIQLEEGNPNTIFKIENNIINVAVGAEVYSFIILHIKEEDKLILEKVLGKNSDSQSLTFLFKQRK
ncbi:MAG: hypothetical protein LBL90_05430 [Prevotellaceae bacterium]|jgi:hypothetical protein|nr:hypothetical protein [Prevotellaceae bacterium]